MKVKKLTTTSGKFIHVYDDVLPKAANLKLSLLCQSSPFNLSNGSLPLLEKLKERILSVSFNEFDIGKLGFFDKENIRQIMEENELSLRDRKRTWVLLGTHLSKYSYHPDCQAGGKTIMYYLNIKWDVDWGGETIFCDDEGEAEIAISCKPNRVVVFDSSILHKPSSISYDAEPYRFTLTSTFEK